MTHQKRRRLSLFPWLPVAFATLACARTSARDATAGPVSARQDARAGFATVFTDTALFKQLCTEADSGLTPRANRCTPRNQAATLRKP